MTSRKSPGRRLSGRIRERLDAREDAVAACECEREVHGWSDEQRR